MRRRLVVTAVAFVLATNALVLGLVALNRAGEPSAVLTLTERELPLAGRYGMTRESTGVSLQIERSNRMPLALETPRLQALDIDPRHLELARNEDWASIERTAFAVLEYDGPAFEAMLAEQADRIEAITADSEYDRRRREAERRNLEAMRTGASRLLAIDIGADRKRLRERYPDRRRYAIVHARVTVRRIRSPETAQPELQAQVSSLLPAEIHVPNRFVPILERATADGHRGRGQPPRYRVEVRWGRRLEPWIASVEPTTGTESRGDDD